jgi:glycosyltransferase involved in cell wall biosynthesis
MKIVAYLADQNPGNDRSYGISRMSYLVLDALKAVGTMKIETISSMTSQMAPESVKEQCVLPWGTRNKWMRLLTDHLHPLCRVWDSQKNIYYFPKGYLPLLSAFCQPSVVTIHDTIIQYDEDHYPNWRKSWDYTYWAIILRHTLRNAHRILTVSESSKSQIQAFMKRHRIPEKEITVTYEPCVYERVPQPMRPEKQNHVIHLASYEPHKRTAHLIRWWREAEDLGRELPALHLIGNIPLEVEGLLASSRTIVKRPFLDDMALEAAYLNARALILPSEIEGFGLPALEAYYLGTPVCFVRGTSVEELLSPAIEKGGFRLDDMESFFSALNTTLSMSEEEIHACGMKLRQTYASAKVAANMMRVFEEVAVSVC